MDLDELFKELAGCPPPVKRSIFVSYHHAGDRPYYSAFSTLFADTYEIIEDNSVERKIDSDAAEYVIRRIREDFITGSSCTVVLCGAETPSRKFVDWEIKATLEKEHGLLAVKLPSNPDFIVPPRLLDNVACGYAVWTSWEKLKADPQLLKILIEQANAKEKNLIRNERDLRRRNG